MNKKLALFKKMGGVFLLLLTFSLSAMAQVQVHGVVLDELGDPAIGATIQIKGTTQGTVADINGVFMISAPAGSTLVISYVGYTAQEVATTANVRVQLQPDAELLDELVVVGYGVQRRVNVTGAITAINAEELTSISAGRMSNTLAGRAPGVTVSGQSGLAGSTSSIRFRGAFGEPLFVIDGVIRDKFAFDALDANEIENLSFLKDGATASIYGSRASNGVILVTTRRGQTQTKPVFNYQASYSTSRPTMTLQSDRFTATDELIYQNRVDEYFNRTKRNSDAEFAYFENRSYNINDLIWQNPWNQRHLLSVSGGGDRITYFAMLGYRGEEGSYHNLKHDRYNMRSSVTAKITDAITFGVNISGHQQHSSRFMWHGDGTDDEAVGDFYRTTFNWPKLYPSYLEADGTPALHRTAFPLEVPVGTWQMWSVADVVLGDNYIRRRNRETNAIMDLNIDLGKFVEGLSTKFVGNYISTDFLRKRYITHQNNFTFRPAEPQGNRFIPGAPDPNRRNIFTFGQAFPMLQYNSDQHWRSQLNWFLNYANTFGKHNVAGMLVWELGQNKLTDVTASGQDPLTDYDQMFVFSTDPARRFGTATEGSGAHMSYIGRANYIYDQRYILEFAFRYDGNTLFPKETRWGFFPSISGAWRVSNEAFMSETASWLSDLRLRGSIGQTGIDLNTANDRISQFSYMQIFNVSSSAYLFGNSAVFPLIVPGNAPNQRLTWATSTTYNGGLDFGFFNQRLTGSFDAFKRIEKDILGTRVVTLPQEYGQGLAPENYAERSFRGFEVSLQWRNRVAQVGYSVFGNMGYAIDRWDVLDQSLAFQPGGNQEWRSAIGQPANRIFGYRTMGMYRTQEEVDAARAAGFTQFGRQPYLGGLYFEDIRGANFEPGADGRIDANDEQLLSKNAAPRINFGFGGSLSWKNFALDLLFQGVGKFDRMISNQEGGGINQHGGTERPYYALWTGDNIWTPDNPNAKYPRIVANSWSESGNGNQTFWLKNGAYVRLKNVNFGYNLPKNIISNIGLSSAQLFVNGENLFFISPAMRPYHDPEQRNYDSYPLMKSFTFGVNIQF
jgi:TonB-linked SusC/RagA family outer membrane protein